MKNTKIAWQALVDGETLRHCDEPGTPPRAGTPDTADIDHSWDGEPTEPPRRGPREAMPTLHDPDPLRHDIDEPSSS